jgi:hypothetical protein
MRVPFTIDAVELSPVKLEPSQYFTNTEFQSENPGLINASEAIKKLPVAWCDSTNRQTSIAKNAGKQLGATTRAKKGKQYSHVGQRPEFEG